MKNPAIEYKIKKAKAYAKKWHSTRNLSAKGNFVPHFYPSTATRALGWWDDVGFMMGSQVVMVAWVHPRLKYDNQCENLAYDQIAHLRPTTRCLDHSTKVYKTAGKSKKRKSVYGFRLKDVTGDSAQWFNTWRDTIQKIRADNTVTVTPHFTVTQQDWCRFVSICVPLEVIDQQSLEDMADMVRSILRGETSVYELFPDYSYTSQDWLKEQQYE